MFVVSKWQSLSVTSAVCETMIATAGFWKRKFDQYESVSRSSRTPLHFGPKKIPHQLLMVPDNISAPIIVSCAIIFSSSWSFFLNSCYVCVFVCSFGLNGSYNIYGQSQRSVADFWPIRSSDQLCICVLQIVHEASSYWSERSIQDSQRSWIIQHDWHSLGNICSDLRSESESLVQQ